MKPLFFLSLPLLLIATGGDAAAPHAPASLEARLIALEKQSWVAWQKQDAAFWETFLSDDHVEVGAGGAIGKKEVIAGIASHVCKVADYKLDHFSFRQLGPDTALLVYWADQTTQCGGVAVPSPVWATSLYQRHQRRWQNALYVHSPATKPAA
jgi:hypothetical protein